MPSGIRGKPIEPAACVAAKVLDGDLYERSMNRADNVWHGIKQERNQRRNRRRRSKLAQREKALGDDRFRAVPLLGPENLRSGPNSQRERIHPEKAGHTKLA